MEAALQFDMIPFHRSLLINADEAALRLLIVRWDWMDIQHNTRIALKMRADAVIHGIDICNEDNVFSCGIIEVIQRGLSISGCILGA
jgi:hypothetical protein